MAYLPPTNTYANVTIPNGGNIVGTGLTYATATGVGSWVASTQAKVRITEEDIEIRGKSLATVLETLEDRLAILVPNPKLEEEFEQLAELRRQYVELEKELSEKIKAWNVLKK
jgi:molybdopterin converting factor small subunit